ncbi:phage tail tape measure protein, lambda family [Pseudomonas synxantha BG33R]|uniref:phage tail tape measure protein n=1 Tax=Pseudomonas synxantha TaxID=47883 RepID=UPI00025FF4B3|nr:phage tail tape measure protein [Pseudomonas synxantha]EIK67649.1 phage tail tape measure protein, lambda family [Pseudomonas synxantha BG33R]
MTSIAELGIKVDSTDATQASSDLDKLAAAGSRAEKAAEGVSKGADKASASLKKQKDELADLLGEINPTVKALGRLDELEAKLARHKGVGLDASTFSEYQGKIQQSREALGRFDDSINRTGNTAKQNAAALRMLPAQFSDIFVSLQGGQAPLTVFLQQGSQIKDSFGGIGAATKALGGYIGGLISPVTIAGAALAGLGLAFYSAQKEASDFNKALFSGAASTSFTSDGLSSIATAASVLTGSFSQAKEAVMALAGSGRLSEKQFVSLANAAAAIGEVTGKSAGEVAASLGGMGDNATKAAQKISSQYGLLTAAQYEAIAALDEQGKKQEALDLLGETLNTNAQKRLERYKQSLSGVEAGWDAIGSAISRAYRNVRSELFPDAKKEIEILERIIKTRQDGGIAGAISSGLSKLNSGLGLADGENDDSTAALQKRLAGLKAIAAASEKAAKDQGDADRAEQARIDAIGKWDARQKSNLTGRAKLESDIKDARQLGMEAGRSEVEIEKEIAGIREKFNKSQPKNGVDLTSFNSAKNNLSDIVNDYKNAQKELDAEQKRGAVSLIDYAKQRSALIKQERDDVTAAYQAEIDALEAAKAKKGTTAAQSIQIDQKIADARQGMVKAQKDADSQLKVLSSNEKGRIEQLTVASQAYVEQLERQRRALSLTGDRNASAVGMGDRESGLQRDLDASRDKFNDERAKLLDRRKTAPDKYSKEDYENDLDSLQDAEVKYRDTVVDNYGKMSEAQGDWRKGATSAYHNYLESARDVAGQTRSLFTNAFSSMEDAVASFVTNGKFSFADFTKSILADMARIATRQAASGLLSGLAGTAIGAWFGGGSAAGAGAGSFGSSIGSALVEGRASGGPVDPNTLYEVNEKGPELFSQGGRSYLMTGAQGGSVTPLMTGGSSIMAAAGGGGGGNTYNFPVSVSVQTAGAGGNATQEDTTQLGKGIQQAAKTEAETAISKGLQPGGSIWRLINGR